MAKKTTPSPTKKYSRKKLKAEPEEAEIDYEAEESGLDEIEEAPPPVATRKHRIVTEYTERRPVDELEDRNADDDDSLLYAEPEPEPPIDPVESFLAGMGGSSAKWDMVVYRLPKFWQDGRTDRNSRIRCGRIDFTEEYEAEVQKRWARRGLRNDFVIVVNRDARYYKQLPTFSCEPPLPEEMAPPDNNPPLPPASMATPLPSFGVNSLPYTGYDYNQGLSAPTTPAPPDPFKEAKKAIDFARSYVEAITPLQQNQQQVVPVISEEAQVAGLLLKDPANVKRMAKNLLGSDNREQSIMALLIENGASIIDAITRGARAIIADVTTARMEVLQNGTSQMAQTPLAPSAGLENSTQQNGQAHQSGQISPAQAVMQGASDSSQAGAPAIGSSIPTPEDQLTNPLLNFVIQKCVEQAGPDIVAESVWNYLDSIQTQYPLYYPTVRERVFMFIDAPTDFVLEFLRGLPGGEPIAALPYATAWTSQLQGKLKADSEAVETSEA
jgi:hypothetical protein